MKSFVIYFLLALLLVTSAQKNIYLNIYASTRPGIGILKYNHGTGKGVGLSIYRRPYDQTDVLMPMGMYEMHYSPVYTELKLDFFRRGTRSNFRYNPFFYGYAGKGISSMPTVYQYYYSQRADEIDFVKVSVGGGINFFQSLIPSDKLHLFYGVSTGVNQVTSDNKIISKGFSLRLNFGLVCFLNLYQSRYTTPNGNHIAEPSNH